MFALALTLHLLQPTLHPSAPPSLRLQVLAADDAVIPPPLVRLSQPAKAALAPPQLTATEVDPDAGTVGVGEVFAGFGGMVLAHGLAYGLTLAWVELMDRAGVHEFTDDFVGFGFGVAAELVLTPLIATTFARLAAGDVIAGSLAKAYVRAFLVHGAASVLAFLSILLGNGGSAGIGVAVALGIVDLFAAPAAASSGLHAVPDAPAVSPAAALRSELPARGGLAFAR